ncbi:MAG: hypothetical protein VW397_06980 [Candidatus Margulisiibacteriota bacterium]
MKLLVFIFLFSCHLFANVYQLSTIVDEQQLVPVIKINGKVVIEIKEVGTKQVFSSPFERSEKIFKTLKELGTQASNLNRIRIRRSPNKADYIAYVDNIELYRVTPSDVVGSELSVYQMAKLWRDNIKTAVKTMTPMDERALSEESLVDDAIPLIGFLSLFSSNSFFVMAIQFSLFVLIQMAAILFTFNFLNRRNKHVFDEFHNRLKKFHHKQIQQNNLLTAMETQIEDLVNQLPDNGRNNISNIK